ncbi:MAG: hypothetical protein IKK08_04075 [Clostridia bacterium]|nr:hypothetical protein [Clostridia bacterium]
MTALENWQEQRPELIRELKNQQEIGDIIYSVRHAILQTEQNTLAVQTDDILRQQLGILFGLLKGSMSLLNIPAAATTWAPIAHKKKLRPGFPFLMAAACILTAAGIWMYAKGDLLGWLLPLSTLVLGLIGLLLNSRARQKEEAGQAANLRTTYSIDTEQLLGAIEAQIVMIDRCAADFAYLNQSIRQPTGSRGWQNLEAVSELLETIYAYDDDLRTQADDAIRQLLIEMGLEAVDFEPANENLFTQLPSKSMTRTLCPALLSTEDHHLLKRGTAVVCTKAA